MTCLGVGNLIWKKCLRYQSTHLMSRLSSLRVPPLPYQTLQTPWYMTTAHRKTPTQMLDEGTDEGMNEAERGGHRSWVYGQEHRLRS